MEYVPVLREYEVGVVKKKLGEGGFCTVSAVHFVTITDGITSSSTSTNKNTSTAATTTTATANATAGAATATATATATERQVKAHVNANRNDKVSSSFTTKEQKQRQKFANQFNNYKRDHFTHKKIVIPQTPSLFNSSSSSNNNSSSYNNASNESGDPTIQRPPKLALKKLKSSLIYGTNKYRTGVHDLMAEISILSKCRSHPNIIFLHAVGYNHEKEFDESYSDSVAYFSNDDEDDDGDDDDDDVDDNDDDNDNNDNSANDRENGNKPKRKKRRRIITFAIIDQLKSTLKNKISKWKEERKNTGLSSLISLTLSSSGSYGKQYNELWLERMVVLFKVADAISFLHSRGILHRDINPSNIGFTEDNVVKLFDFGLAKELKRDVSYCSGDLDYDSNSHCGRGGGDSGGNVGEGRGGMEDESSEMKGYYQRNDDNELFDLTGNTGTLRYMAPEIAAGGTSYAKVPYGFKVDVYSFALVIYEVLSLTKPYAHLVAENFDEEIVRCGHRPPLDDKMSSSWPLAVRTLLGRMWNTDVTKRPCSKEVVTCLGDLLRGEDADLYPNKKTVVTTLKRQFVRGK